ncbi:MLP-like protein 329 [Morus notabilis]|uniref:MLP-like protein 329 n=1 Tax=Morus notabilis TaxID=981085 RepID=W9QBM4_9ROSA|nr:MLP-like protein 34 [Morus notabilis]EXB23151.1 MLP-like protein 329 [Morus notabilis]
MANLKGKVETEVELKATPEQFYNMFRRTAHHLPNVAGHHIKAVEVHEGDWDSHDCVKFWNYTIDGRAETFKEKLEFDDETKTIRLVGLEGDVFKHYKSFTPIYELTPKGNGGVAKTVIEYEKLSEDVPAPDKYLAMAVKIAQDIDAHHSKE